MTKVEFSPMEKEATRVSFTPLQQQQQKVEKKLRFYRQLCCCIYVLLLLVFYTTASAQKEIVLRFDETGRMISQPLPRFLFNGCKDCAGVYKLRARVLLPLDYFSDERDKIDSIASTTANALKNKQSMLSRILSCGKENEYDRLNKIVHDDRDITTWDIKSQESGDEIIPGKLIKYRKFISVLDSIKQHAKDITSTHLIKSLNDLYLEFSPFRFKIGGLQIEDKCMRFVPVTNEDESCNCVLPGKKYIAVEFAIPPGLLTQDMGAGAFEITQHFVMKEFAINRYNQVLAKYKKDLRGLKSLQDTLKKNTVNLLELINAIDDQTYLIKTCLDENRNERLAAIEKKIKELEEKLDKKIGRFDCDASGCNTENIIFCSPALPAWILRLVWLNGELIRLNPFTVTNKTVTAADATLETPKEGKPLSESEMALQIKNDSLTIAFWNVAISHFQDSVLRDKKITIDSAKAGLVKLIAARNEAQKDLNKQFADKAKTEQTKTAGTAATRKNQDQMASLLTVSKTKYKGWIVPYATGENRVWLRNYDYDGKSLISKDKFKFTYPENENLTVLVHNLTPGMAVKISETISPTTDTSEWNRFAYDAVQQITQLYASVQPIAGLVVGAMKSVNKITGKAILDNTPAQLIINSIGFQPLVVDYKGLKDSANLLNTLASGSVPPGSTVTVKANGQTVMVVMSATTDIQKQFSQINKAIYKTVDTTKKNTVTMMEEESCYIGYLKSLHAFRSAPDLIDEPMVVRADTVASYFTYKYALADSIPSYINKYSINVAASDNEEAMKHALKTASFIKVTPYHYFSLAAGLSYSPRGGSITSIDTSGGGFKINRDEDKARLIVGIRWYPAGLFNQKNPEGLFHDKRWLHRLSVLAATGFPKPLENLYLGGGFDIFPGLTVSGGAHFQQQNAYEVVNNQVSSSSVRYSTRFFYSVTMDPTLFISAITSIFKK